MGTDKRAATNCIPSSYVNRFSSIAKSLKDEVDDLVKETDTVEEVNFTNLALGILQAVLGTLNAWAWCARPRRERTRETRARRGRDSIVDE